MKAPMSTLLFPCEKIREFVYDYADGKLDFLTTARVRLHVKICDCCSEYVKIYLMAANRENFRAHFPPPSEFLDKTLEFLEGEGVLGLDDSESKEKTKDDL